MAEAAGSHRERLITLMVALVRAIQNDDQAGVDAIIRLSRSRKLLAPLAFTVGAFAMLLAGVRILLANWRLTLLEIVPALWIWIAMYDLKAHVLHGRTALVLRGPILIPVGLAIIAITIAAYFLTAAFAYAIIDPPPRRVAPAIARARRNLRPIIVAGAFIGALLAFSTTIVTRWGSPWFALSLSLVVGLMMVTYVAVPSRLVGTKSKRSRRDQLTATAIGSALSTTVCTPPYLIGRIGILMLGTRALLIPGVFVLAIGATLQAGATGAVRAIRLSASLGADETPAVDPGEARAADAGDGASTSAVTPAAPQR